MSRRAPSPIVPAYNRRLPLAFWGLAAIAVLFLLVEHRMHLAPYYPYLPLAILLLCPLLHAFGHGGHGGRAGKDAGDDASREHRH